MRFEEIKQTGLSLRTLQNKLAVVPRFKMSSLKLEICADTALLSLDMAWRIFQTITTQQQ